MAKIKTFQDLWFEAYDKVCKWGDMGFEWYGMGDKCIRICPSTHCNNAPVRFQMTVDLNTGLWECSNCGKHGNIHDLSVMLEEDREFWNRVHGVQESLEKYDPRFYSFPSTVHLSQYGCRNIYVSKRISYLSVVSYTCTRMAYTIQIARML